MSRSLKKGPYINVSLEKKILAMNESGKKNVFITVINLSLSTLLRIWLVTSSVSSHPPVALAVMPVTRSNPRVKVKK